MKYKQALKDMGKFMHKSGDDELNARLVLHFLHAHINGDIFNEFARLIEVDRDDLSARATLNERWLDNYQAQHPEERHHSEI